MPYHPNPDITNNQAPIYDASLSYENHGKCFGSVILSVYGEEPIKEFIAGNDTTPHSGWKVVFLARTTVTRFEANNIHEVFTNQITSNVNGVVFDTGVEIMADITRLDITTGICIIYMNCQQS